MGKKEIEDLIAQDITNDVLTQKFLKEIGSEARIDRETTKNDEYTNQLREVLEDIGRDIVAVGKVPKGMEYMGSVAVHIYRAPTLGEVAYYSQLALSRCPEALAGPAVSDLRNSMLQSYGRTPQRKRNGF